MHYHYQETSIGASLHLVHAEPELRHFYFRDPHSALLTIAWNRGKQQKVWVDDIQHSLPQGSVLLLIAKHSFRFERPADITAWRFNRDFYCIVDHDHEVGCVGFIFYGMPSPMLLALDAEHQRKLDLLFQVFVDEYGTSDTIQGEMLRMLLKRLIILLTRLAKVQHLKRTPEGDEVDVIRQFNLLVEKNYQRLHQVADYAELLYKSPKTLSNLFGKYSDKSPLQVIRERIALEAKRLLRYSDKSVGEIGYELGFTENAHFSRFFKKVEGQSPTAFRQSLPIEQS